MRFHDKSSVCWFERERHQERVATVKRRLTEVGLPVMPSPSHIVPVMIGDAALCKAVCDELLQRHWIYVQPINYPTVPRGTERLRLTPSPLHSDADISALVEGLADVWIHLTPRHPAWGYRYTGPLATTITRSDESPVTSSRLAYPSMPEAEGFRQLQPDPFGHLAL